MKGIKAWQTFLLIIVFLGTGGGVYGWRHQASNAKAAALPANTQLVAVQYGNVVNAISANGSLSFPNSADLTFGTASTVLKVNVNVGDSVKKGQSLAAIDSVDLQRAVAQATFNLKTAQTNLINAQNHYAADDLTKASASVALATANLNKALQAQQDGKTPDVWVVAVKKAAVDSAQNALSVAMTPDPLVITTRQNAVTTAQLNLQSAQDVLTTLQAGPSAFDVAKAQATVAQAQANYGAASDAATKFPDDSVKQAAAQMALVNLQAAEQALEKLLAGPSEADLSRTQVAVSNAQTALTQAQKDLLNAQSPDPLVVAQKQLALSQAKQDLLDVQTVNPVTLAQLQLNVASSRVSLNQAQETLAALQAGANADEVALKQLQMDNAKAALDDAQEKLISATMPAPFDGVVSTVNIKVGQTVNANAVAISIVDTTTPQIDAVVSEVDISRVKQGQRATITLDSLPGVPVAGVVSTIAIQGKNTSGVVSYPINVQVTPPAGSVLRTGMTATVTLVVQQANNVLVVPNRAVGGNSRNPTVTVVVNGQSQTKPVTLGLSDDSRTQIVEGISQGDMVLVDTSGSSQQRFFGGPIPGGGIMRVIGGR
ncbi:MAG: efflux RND transporter periplasmic adaptor subunit [Chloroflexi bacterium]|nr:efflux RND transporter periplasmic adaptor subunit [Chloroflexota bacterium]